MMYTIEVFLDGKFEPVNFSDYEIKGISPIDENYFEIAWAMPVSGMIKTALARGSYMEFSKSWFEEKFRKVRLEKEKSPDLL